MGLISFITMLNAGVISSASAPGPSGWDNLEAWDNDEEWINEESLI
jgi:hypothetical protein